MRFCPSESLPGILSLSCSQLPERFLGSKVGQKFRNGCLWGCPSRPSLFDTTFWFSISKATATSWMPPPLSPLNLERTMASTDFSNKSGVLMLYCSRWVRVQSSKEGSLWSWDSAAGPGPLRERVDTIMQGQESSPDFIARKDLRKLVQPIVFGQRSCLLLCFMYKTAEA